MNIKIDSVRFDADQKLVEFIEKKINKLETFYDRIIDCTIILKLENSGKIKDKVAEIKLNVSGDQLFSKSVTKSFEASVDECSEALRSQLIKYKERKSA